MSNGLTRAKTWLEIMGAALAVSIPLVVALIAILAAFGPFTTRPIHDADMIRLERQDSVDLLYSRDTRQAAYWLVCQQYADQGEVTPAFCDEQFPIDIGLGR